MEHFPGDNWNSLSFSEMYEVYKKERLEAKEFFPSELSDEELLRFY